MTATTRRTTLAGLFCLAPLASHAHASSSDKSQAFPLAGTWALLYADILRPDGTRAHDYGEAPFGRLMVDDDANYALQIYAAERPRFASGDKETGTADEFKASVLGQSCHFGTLHLDPAAGVLTVNLLHSAYPNQEASVQKRIYKLDGDVLSYQVPARPDGSIPISAWRRLA